MVEIGEKVLLEYQSTTEVEFSFNDIMYKQVDGVAMGPTLGPIIANVFVGFCEEMIDHEKWTMFYRRDVDDTFTMFHKQEHSVQFFKTLSQIHPALQFTMEVEDDGRLPF